MNQGQRNVVVLTAIVVTLFLTTKAGHTVMHEQAHQRIFEYNNLASNVTYGFLWQNGVTMATLNWSDVAEVSAYRETIPYHVQNEIVGYNVTTISTSIIFAAFMISITIVLVTRKQEGQYEEQ